VEPLRMTPDAFGKFIADETAKWAKVVKIRGHQGRLSLTAACARLGGTTS
jgi:hypothetical protein